MFNHHSLIPWGSFRCRQEEKWGSFRVGIISGSIWGSFQGRGSFRGRDHFGGCTVLSCFASRQPQTSRVTNFAPYISRSSRSLYTEEQWGRDKHIFCDCFKISYRSYVGSVYGMLCLAGSRFSDRRSRCAFKAWYWPCVQNLNLKSEKKPT